MAVEAGEKNEGMAMDTITENEDGGDMQDEESEGGGHECDSKLSEDGDTVIAEGDGPEECDGAEVLRIDPEMQCVVCKAPV